MTIWILCLLLLACSAGMAHRQGAIRTVFSFVGIIVAALLSPMLARFIKPVLKVLGMTHPVLQWMVAPVVVFIIVLAVFKGFGFLAHRKVEVFYKYKAGDLRLALWERLNSRVGMWAGLANGLAYFVIVVWVIYALGYWTVQIAPSSENAWWLRTLNRLSWDLEKTGANKLAWSVDHLPRTHYDMADLAGLIYQNTLLEARLSRYPAFLSLGEREEFQAIAQDQALTEMRLRNAPFRELIAEPQVDKVIRSPETLKLIMDTVVPNLNDLTNFLYTATSPKYDSEPILGRWQFDLRSSILAYRKEKPNSPASDIQRIQQWMAERYARTTIIAAPDRQLFIKDYPQAGVAQPGMPLGTQKLTGQWSGGDGDYLLSLGGSPGAPSTAHVERDRLSMSVSTLPLVFDREQ